MVGRDKSLVESASGRADRYTPARANQAGAPGTYVVLFVPELTGSVAVGRLGVLGLDGGVLLYVGSALGPGGVAARCRHHLRINPRPRWHLDYLRPHGRVLGIWAAFGRERREHAWARALLGLPGASIPLARFGASDCQCPAHLIRLDAPPSAGQLAATLGGGDWLHIGD